MYTNKLDTVSDSLEHDIVVAGPQAVTERITVDDELRIVPMGDTGDFEAALSDVGLLVMAMGTSDTTAAVRRAAECTDGLVVAVCTVDTGECLDPSLLEPIRNMVDVTLLVTRDRPTAEITGDYDDGTDAQSSALAVAGAVDFARMIRHSGHINLDLADARTVLTDNSRAVLVRGHASSRTECTETAVHRALKGIPSTIDIDRASNALVSVVGGPAMSITDATAAVRNLRENIGDTNDIIWGVTTDDTLTNQVTVDIVIDDVEYCPSLSAGDPCRRCGETLSAYTLGDRTTVDCQACGFTGLSMSLDQ
jgi:hypothetical protein